MQLHELVALGESRRRYARRQAWLLIAIALAVLLVFSAMSVIALAATARHPPSYIALFFLGGLIAATGCLIFGVEHLWNSRRPDRYVGGVLTIRRSKVRGTSQITALILVGVGIGISLWGEAERSPDLRGVFIGLLLFSAIGWIGQMGVMGQLMTAPSIALEISEQGLFISDAMREPVRWHEVDALPGVMIRTIPLMSIKTSDPAANRRGWLWRPFGKVSTYVIHNYWLEATQADVLLAIARFQPRLTEALQPARFGAKTAPTA